MSNFENALEFKYPDHSHAAIKLYTDSLYLIQPGLTDVPTIAECIDFCQYEGKTVFSVLERNLVKELMLALTRASFPLSTELLISAYLSRKEFNFVFVIPHPVMKNNYSNL